MDDLDELIKLARNLSETVVGAASDLLSAGVDVEHVHDRYVVSAIELLADAEAQGILAASGNQDAFVALARIVGTLTNLRDGALAKAKSIRRVTASNKSWRALRSDQPLPRRPSFAGRLQDGA
jgi:hypothetical protein